MNSDDYSRKQRARDAEYQREYRAWINSLPADERRKLEAQGLASPSLALHGNGSAKGDAADSPLMRQGNDPALMPEPEPEPSSGSCDAESVHGAIRRVVAEILCHNNARLTTECIALVIGLAYTGSSMTEIAKRHGISRAAVSKRCVELTELLDLPPSRAMRSLTARKRYRDARLKSTRSHEPSSPPPHRKS
jgi:DNA-directed RNA polymerase specialized sigma24 family protein